MMSFGHGPFSDHFSGTCRYNLGVRGGISGAILDHKGHAKSDQVRSSEVKGQVRSGEAMTDSKSGPAGRVQGGGPGDLSY